MLDEVDSLHVERNIFSGLLQFSYYRFASSVGNALRASIIDHLKFRGANGGTK
jgi:hypothetical protein